MATAGDGCVSTRELMVMVSFERMRVNNTEVQNFKPSILEVSTCFQAPILQWSSGMSFEESAKPFLREESSGFFCNFRMTLAHPDICIQYISLSLLVEPFKLGSEPLATTP